MHKLPITQSISQSIAQHNLFTPNEKILVALSGGIDSVVLTHILHSLGYSLHLAHCNFHLRGAESNADEEFVRTFAKNLNITLHCTQFNTTEFAHSHNLSIEMAARELRFKWFHELCNTYNYTKIVVAHNANDSVETFLINLLRGTGIKGLQGIPVSNGKVVRPMLGVWRNQIEHYATQNNLAFRFDSSNASLDFVRNKIRLSIIPELQKITPHAPQSIFNTIENLSGYFALAQPYITAASKELCSETPYGLCINESALLQHHESLNLLYEIVSHYGFHATAAQQMHNSFSQQAGKQFFSQSHAAFHDRNALYIVPLADLQIHQTSITLNSLPERPIEIPQGKLEFLNNNNLRFTKHSGSETLTFTQLQFPLTLRKWRSGDSLQPKGMKGRKKVSDILINSKVPRHYKNRVWVLESAGEIAWLIGFRQSQKFS